MSSSSSSGGRGMEGAPPEEYDWGSAVGEHGPPLTGQLLDNTIAHVWEPHMHWLSGHPLSTKRPTDAASAGANHASGLFCAFLSVSVTHSENRSFDQDRLGADSRRPKKMMRGVFLQESRCPPPHFSSSERLVVKLRHWRHPGGFHDFASRCGGGSSRSSLLLPRRCLHPAFLPSRRPPLRTPGLGRSVGAALSALPHPEVGRSVAHSAHKCNGRVTAVTAVKRLPLRH